MQVAIIIELPQITADEKTVVAQFKRRFFGLAPVAKKYIWPTYFNHANLPGGQGNTGFRIGDPDFDAGQRKPDATGTTLSDVGIRSIHIGFGHSITFENTVPGPLLEFDMGFGKHRCTAGDEQAHMRNQVAVETIVGKQTGVKGRHAH